MAEEKKEPDARPTLKDPKEFNLIRSMYFEDHNPRTFDTDPIELLDRQQQGKYRNQSR